MLTTLFALALSFAPAHAEEQASVCGKLVAACHPSKIEFFTCSLRIDSEAVVLDGNDPIVEELENDINSNVVLHGESYSGLNDEPIFHIINVEKVEHCPTPK